MHGDVIRHGSDSYRYDAFGNELTANANDDNPFRYAGEYFDEETETYYLRNRYYNPSNGRFISEDPIRDGLNYYTYCVNNPIRFLDPFGLAQRIASLVHDNDESIFGGDSITMYSLWELDKTYGHLLRYENDGLDVAWMIDDVIELVELVRSISLSFLEAGKELIIPFGMNGRSNTERVLANKYSFEAIDIYALAAVARFMTESAYGDGYSTSDNADAYRHSLWNQLSTGEVGAEITRLFMNAHEYGFSGNFDDFQFFMQSQMDLLNNEIGRIHYMAVEFGLVDFGNLYRLDVNYNLVQTDGTGRRPPYQNTYFYNIYY